jgi:hypothetical protein
MQHLSKSEHGSTNGIGFLAYMKGWKFDNFSINYCAEFMAMLQERIPARVETFLIVNPPSWFPTIWRIMKPMLSRHFRQKVHVIDESDLDDFLQEGFEAYLPDEMGRGTCSTKKLVEDFITYRKFVEGTDASIRYTVLS